MNTTRHTDSRTEKVEVVVTDLKKLRRVLRKPPMAALIDGAFRRRAETGCCPG
jgi:hypothetical protein